MSPRALLLFELDGRKMAARVEGIRRIAAGGGTDAPWTLQSPLGAPRSAAHGLVVETPGGEKVLGVDRVLGQRTITAAEVLPVPPIAAEVLGLKGLCGLVPLDGELTLLLDVSVLFSELETWAADRRLEGEA